MKATGIVRRIEACVIIYPRSQTVENQGVFADFIQTHHYENLQFAVLPSLPPERRIDLGKGI